MLFNCESIEKSYAKGTLFENLSLSVFSGDRIGLIGLNGCGKSTLMKIIAGKEKSDSGKISPRRDLIVGYVPQDCIFEDKVPLEILVEAMPTNIADYDKERLALMQLEKMGFSGQEPSAARLSGGWKKRLRLAVELVKSPHLLLLDEPTNHLDLEGILWLEDFLNSESLTFMVISHDRVFLEKVTNKMIEIDKVYPQGVFSVEGTYGEFLRLKEQFVQGQLEQEKRMAGKLKKETEWLRAGVKARTTKAQSRIDEAAVIKQEHADLKMRNSVKQAKIHFSTTERETRKLMVATNLSKSIGGKLLFSGVDFTLSPGTRMGLMGPNGCGKTTLLKLLSEELLPDQGTIKRADDLKVVYFDQHRMRLPEHLTLKEALSPTGEFVNFRGNKIHVNGWAERFLFSKDLLGIPISKLSGGEKARITIAHLMLEPADILLLDEPTNDLDIPTLETFENSLLDFPGAVVLISHDRGMLDSICTCLLALGDSKKGVMYSDYLQWEKSKKPQQVESSSQKGEKGSALYENKKAQAAIERKIVKVEERGNALKEKLKSEKDPLKLIQLCNEIKEVEEELSELYTQWERF
jgi:ATP-binding cassette subfamily F protein uup